VTAEQIIEEIKRLDPKDQLGVIRFAYQLDAERRLSGKELSTLAARMTETDDPAEAAIIRESIVRGFYGRQPGEQCLKSGGKIFRPLCYIISSTESVRARFRQINWDCLPSRSTPNPRYRMRNG